MTIKSDCEKIYNLLNETFKDIKPISHTLYEYIHRMKIKIHNIEYWTNMYNKVENHINKNKDTDILYILHLAKLRIIKLYISNNRIEKESTCDNLDKYSYMINLISKSLKDLIMRERYCPANQSFEHTYTRQEDEKIKEMHKTGLNEIKPLITEVVIKNYEFILKLKEEIPDLEKGEYSKCVK